MGFPFPFRYQTFVRYLQGNCDSEQLNGTLTNEEHLYRNIEEYLRLRASSKYDIECNSWTPQDWVTGEPGHPKKIDVVGFRKNPRDRRVSMIMEAKLMMDPERDWPKEILRDLFRVALIKDRTHKRTRRFILVVGQKRCWQKAWHQKRNGILKHYLFLDKRFWQTSRQITLTPAKFKDLDFVLQDPFFQEQQLPKILKIQLKGISLSSITDPNPEQQATGIDVRLWRIYPYF